MCVYVFSGTWNPTQSIIWITDPWSGSQLKFNRLFTGPLPTFPENLMQVRSEVSAQSCYQTDKQTNFWRLNAKLSDNRMNELHWVLPRWRLMAVTQAYYNAVNVTKGQFTLRTSTRIYARISADNSVSVVMELTENNDDVHARSCSRRPAPQLL